MNQKILVLSLAALAAVFALSLAPAPASARCSIHQGGECGRDAIFHQNEPRWYGNDRYLDRNQYRIDERHNHRRIVLKPYTYLQSRTCRDWVQPGGVGPKITRRVYDC